MNYQKADRPAYYEAALANGIVDSPRSARLWSRGSCFLDAVPDETVIDGEENSLPEPPNVHDAVNRNGLVGP